MAEYSGKQCICSPELKQRTAPSENCGDHIGPVASAVARQYVYRRDAVETLLE